MKLHGRILFLADDPQLIRQQLDQQLTIQHAPELHYGVNTDAMISGRACTLGYTPEILGPYFLENFKEAHTGPRRIVINGQTTFEDRLRIV